jgi:hypothetical protein
MTGRRNHLPTNALTKRQTYLDKVKGFYNKQ